MNLAVSEVPPGSHAAWCAAGCPSATQLFAGPEVWDTTGGHAPLVFAGPEVWDTTGGHAPLVFAGPEVWDTTGGHTPLFAGPSSSSSAFDMMVALTRFFLPRVPHIWMSGANPLQTPRAWF